MSWKEKKKKACFMYVFLITQNHTRRPHISGSILCCFWTWFAFVLTHVHAKQSCFWYNLMELKWGRLWVLVLTYFYHTKKGCDIFCFNRVKSRLEFFILDFEKHKVYMVVRWFGVATGHDAYILFEKLWPAHIRHLNCFELTFTN